MKHWFQRRRPQDHEKGQSLVELAASFVFLLVLFVFVVNVGFAAMTLIKMHDAAQDAAVYASLNPKDCGEISDRAIKNRTPTMTVSKISIGGSSTCASASATQACAGKEAEVQVAYSFPVFTPMASTIIGKSTFDLTATAKATIINPVCK